MRLHPVLALLGGFMRLLHASAALLAMVALGCAGAKPYQASFNSPVLQPRDAPEMEKNAVIIAVDPIARENPIRVPSTTSVLPAVSATPRKCRWCSEAPRSRLSPCPRFGSGWRTAP